MDGQRAVEITHRFAAPRERVWDAWTDPAVIRRWWGSDPDGVVTAASVDLRPGGGFAISFTDSTGDSHTSSGDYLRIEEPLALEFTWSWANEPGNTSRISVQFDGDGAGTLMRFVHGELHGATAHDYEQGWRRTFAKLDRVLAHGEG